MLQLEVSGSVFLSGPCVVPPVSSLAVLQSIFFNGSRLHIAVLQSSLIWSSSCISGSHDIVQALWEIVKLDTKVGHPVHRIGIDRIGRFLPNLATHSLLVD